MDREQHEVVLVFDLGSVLLGHLAIRRFHLVGQRFAVPLKSVVDCLRNLEEVVVGVHDEPVGVDAEVVTDRYDRPKQLRNPTSRGSRVDVEDPDVRKRLGEFAKSLEAIALDDGSVGLDRSVRE